MDNTSQLGVYQYYSLLGGGSYYNYYSSSPVFEACWDELHRGPPYHSGGPFYLVRSTYDTPHVEAYLGNPSHNWRGPFVNSEGRNASVGSCIAAFQNVYGFDPSSVSGVPDVPASSASMYRYASPTRPAVNIGQDIGEALVLKDIPHYPGYRGISKPERLRSATQFAKESGNEYLNQVFGWKPLLDDLNKFIKVTRHLDGRLRQLSRDNGRKVKRRIAFRSFDSSDSHSYSEAYYSYGYPLGIIDPGFFTGKGTRTTDRRTTVDKSFVGSFRYWIPDLPVLPRGLHELSIIYGLEPSPSLVWELTPWSWLIDWWSNVGDVLANVSSAALDNLVSTYAYYMEHHKSVSTVVQTFNVSHQVITLPLVATREIKARWPASPYGFGITSDDLSGSQKAILVALGLSKGL